MASKKELTETSSRKGLRFTYADYVGFPDDGQRYEIIEGEVFVTPAPIPDHQRISRCIAYELTSWTRSNPPAEVFVAPIDLILADDTVVQPDVLISKARDSVSERGVEAAPALVVEILSPSTKNRDRGLKRERYARSGVPEYWVVDPLERTLEQYVRDSSGELTRRATLRAGDHLDSESLPGFDMEVSVAFQDLDPPTST